MLNIKFTEFSTKKFKKYYLVYKQRWFSAYKLPRTTKKLLWKPVRQTIKLTNYKNVFSKFFNSGEYFVLFWRKQPYVSENTLYLPIFFFNSYFLKTDTFRFCQYTANFFRIMKSTLLSKRFVAYPLHITSTFLCNNSHHNSIISTNNYLLFLNQSNFFVMSAYYERWLREVCRVIFFFILIKIKYKGKSYKWFRKNKTLVLRFGYSHMVYIKIPNFFFNKKKGKMRLIFFGTCFWNLKSFLSSAIFWRPMNIYTGRGLRFAKQLVFRKFGKVSAYR